MKIVIFLICAALALPFAAAEPSYAARRVALVIGNSNYQNAPALPKAGNNASAMASTFQRAGFYVVIAQTNVGLAQFNKAVAQFKNEAAGSDIAVVYFSGYGVNVEDINYVVPVDAKLANVRDAAVQAITLDSLADAVAGARRLRLVILDALHGNPFAAGKTQSNAAAPDADGGLEDPAPQAGTLIAYPAFAGSDSDDGAGDRSIYTDALLRNLFTPGLDIRLAFGRVLMEVLKITGRQQSPNVYGSLGGGNISLVPAPPDRPMMDLAGEKTDYHVVEQSNSANAWAVFMVQHPNGFYFDSARAKLRLAEAEPVAPAGQPGAAPSRRSQSATLETPPAQAPGDIPEPGTAALISLAQQELTRVGCYSGTTSGELDQATREAVRQYEKAQGQTATNDVVITRDLLAELEKQTTRICPLICPAGQTAQGDQCVGAGNSKSVVHRKDETPAKHPATKPASATAASPQPHSAGQASSSSAHSTLMPGVGF
jgi:hypothetical protein